MDMPPDPPEWEPVTAPRLVFRFLKKPDRNAVDFADNFKSDAERDKEPLEGEHPDFQTGISVFVSEAAARKRWAELKVAALKNRSDRNKRRGRPVRMTVGEHIGEVLLGPNQGFEVAGEDSDGHLTARGDKDRFASKVVDIYPAERPPT
jgi:hypothetical protein